MKSLITLILLSVTFLFFTAGCSIPKISFLDKFKRADSQQAPADEAGEAGEADTFDVLRRSYIALMCRKSLLNRCCVLPA